MWRFHLSHILCIQYDNNQKDSLLTISKPIEHISDNNDDKFIDGKFSDNTINIILKNVDSNKDINK